MVYYPVDNVEEMLREFPNELGITLDVVSYNIVIKAFCKMGDFDFGVLVLDDMAKKGLKPDLITFNTLLDGLYGSWRFAVGEKIWSLMESKNIVPNVRSYNSRLQRLVLEKGELAAVDLLGEMKRNGIKSVVISYNTVIKGHCDDGNVEKVKRWYRKLRETECVPDRATYMTLVPFLCAKGDFGMAL